MLSSPFVNYSFTSIIQRQNEIVNALFKVNMPTLLSEVESNPTHPQLDSDSGKVLAMVKL